MHIKHVGHCSRKPSMDVRSLWYDKNLLTEKCVQSCFLLCDTELDENIFYYVKAQRNVFFVFAAKQGRTEFFCHKKQQRLSERWHGMKPSQWWRQQICQHLGWGSTQKTQTVTFKILCVGPLISLTALGEKNSSTILIFNLCWSQEDSTRHLHFSSGPIMRSINLAVLTELSQDLAGFHRVSPNIVSMANIKR